MTHPMIPQLNFTTRLLAIVILIALTLTISRPAAAADQKAVIANFLGEHLYCHTMAIASGYSTQIGFLVGLAISAAGFYLLIFKGLSVYSMLLLIGGVVLTAMPGLFLAGLKGTQAMFQSLSASSAVSAASDAWQGGGCARELALQVDALPTGGGTAGGGGGTGESPGAEYGTERGLRNNNPLNLHSLKSSNYAGQVGRDKEMAQFVDPQHGYRQAYLQLKRNQNVHGKNTLLQQISRWAPASDGNNPEEYADFVAARMRSDGFNITRDSYIDTNNGPLVRSMMKGMTEVEVGVGATKKAYGNQIDTFITEGIRLGGGAI